MNTTTLLPPESSLSLDSERYWRPDPVSVREACSAAHGLVVDLCPGSAPLPYDGAVRVGWGYSDLDITKDRLPFADKEVDFLYCRHTLEDLLDPLWAIGEIARVAKSGWIETPSVISELARGVDGGAAPWRGYIHHRSLFWNDQDTLCLAPKYACLEYADLSRWDLASALKNRWAWNNVYRWSNGSLQCKQFRHEVDFHLVGGGYENLLNNALKHAQAPPNTSTAEA